MIKQTNNMDIQTIISLIIVGIFAGILSGLVGIGGGIILVPALVYLLGFSQMSAQGTSLALIMFPVGILGVMQYYKHGYVDFKIIPIIAIGFIVGSFFGGKISTNLPQDTIKKIFAALLFIIALKMMFFDKRNNDAASAEKSSNKGANR
jgi:uncharacterized membrane protein YfcA